MVGELHLLIHEFTQTIADKAHFVEGAIRN